MTQCSCGMLTIGRIACRREGGDTSAQRGRSVIYDCLVLPVGNTTRRRHFVLLIQYSLGFTEELSDDVYVHFSSPVDRKRTLCFYFWPHIRQIGEGVALFRLVFQRMRRSKWSKTGHLSIPGLSDRFASVTVSTCKGGHFRRPAMCTRLLSDAVRVRITTAKPISLSNIHP